MVGVIAYFYFASDTIVLRSGKVRTADISTREKNIIIEDFAVLEGGIVLGDGDVFIGKHAEVRGDISIENGDLTVEDEGMVRGDISVVDGDISLGSKAAIEGDVVIKNGELQKNSQAKISGSFPPIFKTTDYPPVLAYFEILPQDHKEAVGYIFLTKQSNTAIREENVKTPTDYFEGIYYYENNELKNIDMENEEQSQRFFDKAAAFFRGVPERNLGAFGVGATTEDFAINPAKADIYIPAQGSEFIFIHEVGHVLDFKYDFSDFHQPKYPFISREVALNDYAAIHPGEDFAEAYKYYALNPAYFAELIDQYPERQQKYDYLKNFVFKGKEFW